MKPLYFMLPLTLALPACDQRAVVIAASGHKSAVPGLRISESGNKERVMIDGIRSDLFNAPSSPVSNPSTSTAVAPPSTPAPQPAPSPPSPLEGWEYVGDVEIGGERLALLERKDSKEGVYLKAGDTFKGLRVVSFTKQNIQIADSGISIARKQDWLFNAPRPTGSTVANPTPTASGQKPTASSPGTPGVPATTAPPSADSATVAAKFLKSGASEFIQQKLELAAPAILEKGSFSFVSPSSGEVSVETAVIADSPPK